MKHATRMIALAFAFSLGSIAAAQDASSLPATQDRGPAKAGVPGVARTVGQSAPPSLTTRPALPGQNPLTVTQESAIVSPRDSIFPRNSQGMTVYGNSPFAVSSRFGGTSKKERELNQKIREFVSAVKGAADSQSEENATRDLRDTLSKLFDERMKRRETEIEQLKKRLEELKTKNEARKRKKDEIVDLKLKSMVNEAKGFGF